jgi:hypothetical protein
MPARCAQGEIEPTYEFLQSPLAGNARPSVPVQMQVLRHAAIRAEARHFGAYCGWALSRAIRAQACACCAHVNALAGKPSGNVKNIPMAAKVIFFIRYAPKIVLACVISVTFFGVETCHDLGDECPGSRKTVWHDGKR